MRKFSLRHVFVASALAMAATSASADTGLKVDTYFKDGNHGVYLKGGFLGAGLGYGYGINEKFTLRGDFTTAGSYSRTNEIGNVDYDLKIRNNVGTVSVDFFPFDNGFRLTAGVGLRDTRMSGYASGGEFQGVQLGLGDSVYGKLKWPTVAPYLGLGWGHNYGQGTKAGWGFVADAGVYVGKPKVSLWANDSAMAKLDAQTGGNGQSLLDQELDEWKDEASKMKLFPVIHVGVSYRF